MSEFLGIDTSNYTTSAALYNDISGEVFQKKMLLPVKKGEAGLRQSDAVFHHTRQLPPVCSEVLDKADAVEAIGVSVKPRSQEGSYMPCFLSGNTAAELISHALGVRLYKTSHQLGHIAAALYSAGKTELMTESFIAFHVSGGTTECLFCTPDDSSIIKAGIFSSSLDLKAGQAVDRIGIMLGLDFPCGAELEKLALKSDKKYSLRPVMKGNDCCLSGIENKCRRMLDDGFSPCDIAAYCLSFICTSIEGMTEAALSELGDVPVVYSGGVMSDSIIRKRLEKRFGAYFAAPEFSCDNASGVALLASEMHKRGI